MKKLIEFSGGLRKQIQDFANENFNGNFHAAVLHLCIKGLESQEGK